MSSKTRKDIIDDLFNLKIRRGYTEYQLKQYLMSHPYNYSLRNTQIYLKLLREHIIDVVKLDQELAIAETIEQMERIHQDLLRENNKKLALEYRKEINKLKGIGTQKIDVTSNGQTIIPQIIHINTPDNPNMLNE